jgi:hypothetical protein
MIMPGDRGANAANALIKSQWLGKELTFTDAIMRRKVISGLGFMPQEARILNWPGARHLRVLTACNHL